VGYDIRRFYAARLVMLFAHEPSASRLWHGLASSRRARVFRWRSIARRLDEAATRRAGAVECVQVNALVANMT
jgi:hypothetical protein